MKKKSSVFIYVLIMGLLVLVNSCKEKEDDTKNIPVLTTVEVSEITQTTAISGGHITSDAGSTIISRGVCWSTNQTPTIADSKTVDGTGAGSFTSNITGLTFGTIYYVRAYATNSKGTGYGSAMSFTTQDGVADIDGNVYHIVTIGTQVWMAENLKTTKYRDGTSIQKVIDGTAWSNLSTGAYSEYDNILSNSATYGRLYNWYAVTDSHNIAPVGWHVPTGDEWTTLVTYLGGILVAGGKLKDTGTTHWDSPNTGATNETGFTALPGGYRFWNGAFFDIRSNGYWWSTTEVNISNALNRYMFYNLSNVNAYNNNKQCGFSVRCVKD